MSPFLINQTTIYYKKKTSLLNVCCVTFSWVQNMATFLTPVLFYWIWLLFDFESFRIRFVEVLLCIIYSWKVRKWV